MAAMALRDAPSVVLGYLCALYFLVFCHMPDWTLDQVAALQRRLLPRTSTPIERPEYAPAHYAEGTPAYQAVAEKRAVTARFVRGELSLAEAADLFRTADRQNPGP